METLSVEHGRTDASIEDEANRKLAKRLSGIRIRFFGLTSMDFVPQPGAKCPVCGTGDIQSKLDNDREHGVCLACGLATKWVQRSVENVISDMNRQLSYWRNFRLSQIKFQCKGVGRGNRGADPGRGIKRSAKALMGVRGK